jgi:hypothetical protein
MAIFFTEAPVFEAALGSREGCLSARPGTEAGCSPTLK